MIEKVVCADGECGVGVSGLMVMYVGQKIPAAQMSTAQTMSGHVEKKVAEMTTTYSLGAV